MGPKTAAAVNVQFRARHDRQTVGVVMNCCLFFCYRHKVQSCNVLTKLMVHGAEYSRVAQSDPETGDRVHTPTMVTLPAKLKVPASNIYSDTIANNLLSQA